MVGSRRGGSPPSPRKTAICAPAVSSPAHALTAGLAASIGSDSAPPSRSPTWCAKAPRQRSFTFRALSSVSRGCCRRPPAAAAFDADAVLDSSQDPDRCVFLHAGGVLKTVLALQGLAGLGGVWHGLRLPMRPQEELNCLSSFLADPQRGEHRVVDLEDFFCRSQLQHFDQRSDIRQIGLSPGPQFHG